MRDVFVIATNDSGVAYNADKPGGMFNKEDLEFLKQTIDLTIKHYQKESITDLYVDMYNERAIEQMYAQFDDKPQPKPGMSETFVYIMLDEGTGSYKIGRSKNPQERESTLQSEKPTIVLLKTYKGMIKDETFLHQFFEDKRGRGEWFNLDQNDLKIIDSYFKVKCQ